jgi:hypothetical protein
VSGYLLSDPALRERTPGQEFAVAALSAPNRDVEVALRTALPATFPLAATRPRYTVRHLLKTAEVTDASTSYLREEHAGRYESGASYASTPESSFRTSLGSADVTTLVAELAVPKEITANAPTLAAVVDHRLVVRLCTVENDALLNGTRDGAICGIRNLPDVRRSTDRGDVDRVVTETAAAVEETGGSCDGIVGHPRLYWELVRLGLLGRLAEAGVRVSRTRMLPPGEALFADFRAAFTLLDTLDSRIGVRRGAGTDGSDLLWASVRVALAVHLPQHVVLRELDWPS